MITSLLAFVSIFFLFKATHDIMLNRMFKQFEEDQFSKSDSPSIHP